MTELGAGDRGFLAKTRDSLVKLFSGEDPRDNIVGAFNRHYGAWDIQRVQNVKVNFLLSPITLDLADAESGGKDFDNRRQDLKKAVLHEFNHSVPKQYISKENLEAMTRQTYVKLSRGLLELAVQSKDDNLRQTYKGIAWSVIVKDANDIFIQQGIPGLDGNWKTGLWRMINVKNPDMSRINAELDKFVNKDQSTLRQPVDR